MQKTAITNATVVTPMRSLDEYAVMMQDGLITDVLPVREANFFGYDVYDAKGSCVVPGYVDIHVHGGMGGEANGGTINDFETMNTYHARHGTTTMLPTTGGIDAKQMFDILAFYEENQQRIQKMGPFVPGLHLEGPYLSEKQAGAMVIGTMGRPTNKEMDKLASYHSIIRMISAAPEVEGVKDLARKMRPYKTILSIGHSDASESEVLESIEAGFSHVTHLYSAMSTIHREKAYRILGVIESAYLYNDLTVEVIGDGHHLPASLLQLIYRNIGSNRIALITDATAPAGFPDGLVKGTGQKQVLIENGVAKLPDRSVFAGSVTTMDRVMKNMMTLGGASINEAVKMASTTPARIIGYGHRKGMIAKGMDADVVVLGKDYLASRVYVAGQFFG